MSGLSRDGMAARVTAGDQFFPAEFQVPAQCALDAVRGSGTQRGDDLLVIVACALGQFSVLFADPSAVEKKFSGNPGHFEKPRWGPRLPQHEKEPLIYIGAVLQRRAYRELNKLV